MTQCKSPDTHMQPMEQPEQGMTVSSSETLDARYMRRLQPDPDGGYTATILEFPGCFAEGDSAEEALYNLEQTALSWMRSARANGYPVHEPIDFSGVSGKIALRISRRLHRMAAERAELEGTSLNQFIGNALATYLGQKDGVGRLVEAIHDAARASLQFWSTVTVTPRADVPIRSEGAVIDMSVQTTDSAHIIGSNLGAVTLTSSRSRG